jgi:hypothetical protein
MHFISDHHEESKRQNDRGRCLHFADGVRCNEIIAAHSIQKRGQLGLIAEDGHVYRLNADPSTLRDSGGIPYPKRIGIRKASTFVGFCKHHDNALFAPIDNATLEPRHQQIALYAYRSLCREYFVKENAVAVLGKLKDHPDIDSQRQSMLKAGFVGHSLGLDGLRHHKQHYDEALKNNLFDEFEFTYFTSSSRCSLQLSGLLYPDFDFLGQRLQDLGNWKSPLDLIAFFTAPTADGWAYGFAWHQSSNRTCVPFMQSLASQVHMGQRPEDMLVRFSLSCCENHAFRISWWDSLPATSKQSAVERVHLMVHPSMPVPSNYLACGCEGLADWNFEYVQTTLPTSA